MTTDISHKIEAKCQQVDDTRGKKRNKRIVGTYKVNARNVSFVIFLLFFSKFVSGQNSPNPAI